MNTAKFSIGQLIQHRLFNYRGVVLDVHPSFSGTEEWYDNVALSHPPKDQPWYQILVHNATHSTYVAERNLENDATSEPINHPMMDDFFETFSGSVYKTKTRAN